MVITYSLVDTGITASECTICLRITPHLKSYQLIMVNTVNFEVMGKCGRLITHKDNAVNATTRFLVNFSKQKCTIDERIPTIQCLTGALRYMIIE